MGKVITSHGYVKIKNKDHHLADAQGYVYEHRLVAEETLGRRLTASEVVHHIDGDKTNNAASNLAVCKSELEHKVHHRKSGKRLRLPGERNPLVMCACGCGEKLRRFDAEGRFRSTIYTHSGRGLAKARAWATRRANAEAGASDGSR